MINLPTPLESAFSLLKRNLNLSTETIFYPFNFEGKSVLQIGGSFSLAASILQNSPLTLLPGGFSEYHPEKDPELFLLRYLEAVWKELIVSHVFSFEETKLENSFLRDVLIISVENNLKNEEFLNKFIQARNSLVLSGEVLIDLKNEKYWKFLLEKGEVVQTGVQAGFFLGKLTLPRWKIALASLSIGEEYKKKVYPGILGKKAYCRKFEYDFRDDEDVYDPERPPAWSKVKLILKLLKENSYDYIVWIDSDTLLQDFQKRIEDIILKFGFQGESQAPYDLLFTRDFHTLNSGVMFIRNTAWSKAFFEKVYSQTEFIHDPNWEQTSIIHLVKDEEFCKGHIHLLDPYKQREFNSYYCNFEKGDWLIHFPGCFRLGKNNGLDDMMRRLNPIRLEEDTEDRFLERLKLISRMNKK